MAAPPPSFRTMSEVYQYFRLNFNFFGSWDEGKSEFNIATVFSKILRSSSLTKIYIVSRGKISSVKYIARNIGSNLSQIKCRYQRLMHQELQTRHFTGHIYMLSNNGQNLQYSTQPERFNIAISLVLVFKIKCLPSLVSLVQFSVDLNSSCSTPEPVLVGRILPQVTLTNPKLSRRNPKSS